MNLTKRLEYQALFKKAYSLYSRRDVLDLILLRLTELGEGDDPSCIYLTFGLLKCNDSAVRTKAAKVSIQLFDKLRSQNQFDRCLKDVEISVSDLSFFKKNFSEADSLKLLAIASFNGNGYVREKAIKMLAETKNPFAIKYLLFRLADWVPAVRIVAKELLDSFMNGDYRMSFIANLELVKNLKNIRRSDLEPIQQEILYLIYSKPSLETKKGFTPKTRFIYYAYLLEKAPISQSIIDDIFADDSYLVRTLLFKKINSYDSEIRKQLVVRGLRDSSSRVRLYAIFVANEFVDELKDELKQLLCDTSATIRYVARKLLGEDRAIYRAYYLKNIENNQQLLGSLLGLADLYDATDLPLFDQYMSHQAPLIVLCCFCAISHIAPDKAYKYALTLISSENGRLRKKASDILAQRWDKASIEQLREVYQRANIKTKKAILSVYNRIGGYQIISDLMLGLLEESSELQDIAWAYIAFWQRRAISLYTSNEEDAKRRAIEIHALVGKQIKLDYSLRQLWEELPFFFR